MTSYKIYRKLLSLPLIVMFIFSLSTIAQADSDICYVVADSGDQLEQVDRTGGAPIWTDIGATGTSNIEAAAIYLDGVTLYAANAGQLGTLDTGTGTFTATSSTFGTGSGADGNVTFDDVDGLAFDPLTGDFYGAQREGGEDLLFRIDRTTGAHVPDAFGTGIDYVVIQTQNAFGSSNLDDIDDIAIDPRDGQMYGVANNNGTADHLIRIDKLTGSVTDVAIFNNGGVNVVDMEGLGFYNNGVFYGTTGNGGGGTGTDNSLWEIELATAIATLITDIEASSGRSDYEGVGCLTGGGNHITGTVFVDNDRDGVDNSSAYWPNVDIQLFLDVNGDGFVDAGDILIQTETTDAFGDYDFLVAATGPFVIRVDIATQPAGNSFTTDNIETADFTIGSPPSFGVTDGDNDFGLGTGINTISGNVFYDHINEDGILDPGELGESGVTVRLYEDNNNNGIVDAGDHWTGSVVTDSNGDYSFEVGTGNFVIDIDPSDLPSGATQTTNPPNFTQEADFSNPALSESDTGNDFGFKLPPSDLGVTKASSIAGNAAPGDTIEYTITITNNGSTEVTNVVVDDILPENTTYTTQSTLVTGFASGSNDTFADDFRTDSYSGNQGSINFAGNWIEDDDDGGGSGGGNIRIDNDSTCPGTGSAKLCLEVESETNGDDIYRQLNLSAYTSATLTYDYTQEDMGNGVIVVEVSSDGGTNYTVLETYSGNVPGDLASGSESFDISGNIASNTRIRFRVISQQNNRVLRIDNVVVTAQTSATATVKDNIPGGTNTDLDSGVPATLVTANDDFTLQPAQQMTVTYSVLVNSPLTTLPAAITNTVSVTSDQTPDPKRATVSDPIGYDFGDIPASYGDASHIIDPDLYIGSVIGDAESAPASRDGFGDDNNTGTNDEDGVTFRSPAGTNQSIFADVVVTNNTGETVTVCGWLDVPSGSPVAIDGDFADTNEGVCQTTSAVNPTLTFQWSNLPNDKAYSTFARFRVSRDPNLVAGAPEITTYDGEISDFALSYDFTPTAVTIGKVELFVVESSGFLTGLNAEQMTETELLALLASWDADLAQALANADRQSILDALIDYLDPDRDGQLAVLAWDTLEERGTIGFYVERREGENGIWEQVNNDMLPGLITAPMGGEYQLADPAAQAGITYQYQLIELEARGTTRTYGPFTVEIQQ